MFPILNEVALRVAYKLYPNYREIQPEVAFSWFNKFLDFRQNHGTSHLRSHPGFEAKASLKTDSSHRGDHQTKHCLLTDEASFVHLYEVWRQKRPFLS